MAGRDQAVLWLDGSVAACGRDTFVEVYQLRPIARTDVSYRINSPGCRWESAQCSYRLSPEIDLG